MNKISIDIYNEQALKIPIVCLHGFLETKEMWSHLHLFFDQHPIYCLDLPGHGKSKLKTNCDCSIDTFAKMIAEALDKLKVREFFMIGHSMGGYVGLAMLELYPERLKSLVLLNSNYYADSDTKKKDRLRTIQILKSKPDLYFKQAFESLFYEPMPFQSLIDVFVKRAKTFNREGIIFAMESIMNRKEQTELVIAHRERIYYIQGENDGMYVDPVNLHLAYEHVCTIKQSKHMSIFEKEDSVISYLQQYCLR